MPVSLPMALATVARLAEGRFQPLEPTFSEGQLFRVGTVSKRPEGRILTQYTHEVKKKVRVWVTHPKD
jgi:hypothetical protein